MLELVLSERQAQSEAAVADQEVLPPGSLLQAWPFRFVSRSAALSKEEGLFYFDSPRRGECWSLRLYPSLFFTEALAQAAQAFLAMGDLAVPERTATRLVAVERFRIYGRGRPGDSFLLKVRRQSGDIAALRFQGSVWLGHRLLAEGFLELGPEPLPSEEDT